MINEIKLELDSAKIGNNLNHQFLTFQVNSHKLAVEILRIREIIEFGKITVVPMMQQFIRGVINLRGSVVPVVDLSARFGLGETDMNQRTCIVILESRMGEEAQIVGFIVEAVNAVVNIGRDAVSAPPKFGSAVQADFLHGIGKVDDDFVLFLNTEQLLNFEIPAEILEGAELVV